MAYPISLLTNGPTSDLVGRFLYMLVLVAFMALLAYWLAKVYRRRGGGIRLGNPKGNLEIFERLGVGAQSTLVIVRAGVKFFLVGITRERINVLAELGADDLSLPEPGSMPDNPFGEMFKRIVSRGKPDENQGEDGGGSDG